MDKHRLVEISGQDTVDPAGSGRGSGYLIGDGLVLTAAHCVLSGRRPKEVEIRRLGSDRWLKAAVVWPVSDGTSGHGPEDPAPGGPTPGGEQVQGMDLALVELSEPWDGSGSTDPETFGVPIGTVDWRAYGFPALEQEGKATEPECVWGRLEPATGSRSLPSTGRRSTYALDTGLLGTGQGETNLLAWQGMSGGPVICEDRIVALVVSADGWVSGRLRGLPVAPMWKDDRAVAILRSHGLEEPPQPVWGRMGLLEQAFRPGPALVARGMSRAVMLQARRRVIPLVGRAADLDALTGWCLDGPSCAVRLVVGDAGSGKTRLAAELCERLAAKPEWVAGFLSTSAHDFSALDELPDQRLIVLDDALQHLDQLHQFLDFVDSEAGQSPSTRWRVLVLARQPYVSWWAPLSSRYPTLLAGDVHQLTAPAQEERLAIYRAADEYLGPRLGAGPAGRDLAPDKAAGPAPDLSDPVFDSYAAILFKALVDCDPRGIGTDDPTRNLAEELLRIEADSYWRTTAEREGLLLDGPALERVVALASVAVAQGESVVRQEGEAARLLRTLPDLSDASERDLRRIARWQHGLYDAGEGYFRPLRPHLLATEAFYRLVTENPEILQALLRYDPDDARQPSDRVADLRTRVAQSVRVLSTLLPVAQPSGRRRPIRPEAARALQDLAPSRLDDLVRLALDHARTKVDDRPAGSGLSLEALLVQLLRIAPCPEQAAEVTAIMPPERNLRLDDLALELQYQAATHYEAEQDRATRRLAEAVLRLSRRRHDLDDLEAARKDARRAVSLQRVVVARTRRRLARSRLTDTPAETHATLAAAMGAEYTRLASAWSNLSTISCDLDLRVKAVEESRRAHAALSRVSAPDVSVSPEDRVHLEVISNLSRTLRRAGIRHESCRYAWDALRFVDSPLVEIPDAVGWQALAHRRFSSALSDVGEVSRALTEAESAVSQFTLLWRQDPDRWSFDRAKALRNLAERRTDVGDWDGAEHDAVEAETAWIRLASHHDAVYDQELAKARIVLARALLRKRDLDRAEAALARVPQDRTSPTPGWLDTMAAAETVRAEIAAEQGRPGAAATAQRALDLLSRIDAGYGAVADLHRARSLFVLARCQHPGARAVETARAAEELCARLRTDDPCTAEVSHFGHPENCRLPAVVQDARDAWTRHGGAAATGRR